MSTYEVTLEDGSVYEITTEETLAPPPKLNSAGEALTGGLINLLQGMTFGAGDEIVAGGSAVLDALTGGPGYSARLKQARDLSRAYAAEEPMSAALNNLPAIVAPFPNVLSKAKGFKTILSNVGKSAGLGAAYGAGSGFLSGEGKGRFDTAKEGAQSGAALGGALGATGEILRGLGGRLKKAVPELERKSVGARQSDYAKTAKDIGILETADGIETTTKAALDDLLLNNKLGDSRDPQKLLRTAYNNEKEIAASIGALIGRADKNLKGPVIPTWERALEMIESGKVPGEKIDAYMNRLKQLDNAIQSKGAGRLSFIQQQKIALGKAWDPNDSVLNEFNRALYTDLQRTVENVVPEVAILNRELAKYKVVKPILQRLLAAQENVNPIDKLIQAIKTTGGFGTLVGGATIAGGPPGFAAGLGTAATMRYLRTPQGQKLLADLYKNVGPAIEASGEGLTRTLPALSGKSQTTMPQKQSSEPEEIRYPSSNGGLFSPAGQQKPMLGGTDAETPTLFRLNAGKKNGIDMELKYKGTIEKVLPAIIQQESGGRPDAKSPKGAMGLMQVMPGTFKEVAAKLGIKNPDPFNEDHNIQVGTAYLDALLDEFGGDLALALAAYNAGPNRVKQLRHKYGKRLVDIYPQLPLETQKYILGILSKAVV